MRKHQLGLIIARARHEAQSMPGDIEERLLAQSPYLECMGARDAQHNQCVTLAQRAGARIAAEVRRTKPPVCGTHVKPSHVALCAPPPERTTTLSFTFRAAAVAALQSLPSLPELDG